MANSKVLKNASWIMVGRIGQSVLGLIITMLTARYFGPSNFGLITYAASLVSFVVPVMQLGLNHIMVQEIVDHPESEGVILGTSTLMNVISAVACMVGVVSFAAITNPKETDTIIICMLYSVLLLFQAFHLFSGWFQAKYLAKHISIISLLAYAITAGYKFLLLALGKSVYWFALANALDCMIIAIGSYLLYKKEKGQKLRVSKEIGNRLFQKSKYYIISGLMVNIFAQTDKIMLKAFIGNEATAFYSAAVTCAGFTGIIVGAAIDSLRPSIFEAKKIDIAEYEEMLTMVYSFIIGISLAQSIGICLFSRIMINLIYGSAYAPAIPVLRLIVWYTTFNYLGSIRNIWLLSEEKQKYLWQINLYGALMNVLLNAVLIPSMDIMGAALASLITQIFTNVILGFLIKPIRRNNALMIRGLDPRYIIQLIRRIR